MALTINTTIKNDADGYLIDDSAVKMQSGETLTAYAAKRPPVEVVTELPEEPDDNTIYLVCEEDIS